MLSLFSASSAFTAGAAGSAAVVSARGVAMPMVERAPAPIAQATAVATSSGWAISDISPDGKLTQRIEGTTRKTWKFNDYSKDRVAVALTSEGRPINSDVQLWLGPDWTPMSMKAYSEDGKLRPIETVIGTRNKAAMIEVRNVGMAEFPFKAAANYATGDAAEVATAIPASTSGERVDGGALRSYPLAVDTEALEVVLNTDGKQLNAKIELLNAPNNPKQTFEVFTNNGELNSLCVKFQVPDQGTTVRIVNLAPVEFPLNTYLKEY